MTIIFNIKYLFYFLWMLWKLECFKVELLMDF